MSFSGQWNTGQSMFSPAQLRAARGLLGWSQDRLAEAARVSVVSIKKFETGASDPRRSTMIAIRTALAKAGVDFIDEASDRGEGVAFRRSVPKQT